MISNPWGLNQSVPRTLQQRNHHNTEPVNVRTPICHQTKKRQCKKPDEACRDKLTVGLASKELFDAGILHSILYSLQNPFSPEETSSEQDLSLHSTLQAKKNEKYDNYIKSTSTQKKTSSPRTGVASHPGTDCDQSAANQMECWMLGMLFPSALQ